MGGQNKKFGAAEIVVSSSGIIKLYVQEHAWQGETNYLNQTIWSVVSRTVLIALSHRCIVYARSNVYAEGRRHYCCWSSGGCQSAAASTPELAKWRRTTSTSSPSSRTMMRIKWQDSRGMVLGWWWAARRWKCLQRLSGLDVGKLNTDNDKKKWKQIVQELMEA